MSLDKILVHATMTFNAIIITRITIIAEAAVENLIISQLRNLSLQVLNKTVRIELTIIRTMIIIAQ